MKEIICELRETIRRLRPHLLVTKQQPDSAAAEGSSQTTFKSSSVQTEAQLEAASDLVNAISGFVWSLDQLWDSCLTESAGDDADEKKSSSDVDRHQSNLEPQTEWNDEAKSIIREGYEILYTISTPKIDVQHQNKHQHVEELRCIVRTSILELLPSLNTSVCRHFLLGFLSHFIPLSIMVAKGMVSSVWSPPSWLHHDVDSSQRVNCARETQPTDNTSTENTMQQFLETFESLIQTDPSTLAPFLSTMSLLFDQHPDENIGQLALVEGSELQFAKRKMHSEQTAKSDSTEVESKRVTNRKKCCHLCISSLPSISEHDLPSVLQSLFTLVCDREDGIMTVQAIRKEWMSISASRPDDDSVLFIGNVVVLFLLSDRIGADHVAVGFLDEITETLREHFSDQRHSQASTDTDAGILSTLDSMVIMALYTKLQHQHTIETLVDSLVSRQSSIAIDFVLPLIRLWSSRTDNHKSFGGRYSDQTKNLLGYEELAAPLISLLFYLLISTSITKKGPGYLEFVRTGGMLPFCNLNSTTQSVSATNQSLSFSSCKVFEELYSVLDGQRKEQIINSLMSIMTDSFVQSYLASNRESKQLQTSPGLLGAAYSACCTLLLLSQKYCDDIAQRRGTIIDRLFLCTSQERGDTTYALFDMNSALLVALLQGINNHDSGGVSELLIICQKFLFTPSYGTKMLDPDNSNQHRVICGIILAARLLRCIYISRSERRDVWESVVKLLNPPTTTSSTSRILDPEIGSWGLCFLTFASSSISCGSSVPRSLDTSPVCGERDMFSIVNNMLAAAGVIQMENDLKVPIQSENGEAVSFLAFDKHNSAQSQKDKAPRFVISSSYLLSRLHSYRDKDQMLDSIDYVALYANHLVDCYLELGKCKEQGWNPKGWLLSKIQLPCALPDSLKSVLGMDKIHELELDSNLIHTGDSRIKSVVDGILHQKRNRAAVVHELVHFMNTVIVAISISCAVLKHANEHYQRLISHNESNEQHEMKKKRRLMALQKLLQFQLSKIYHLQEICEVNSTILKGIHAEVCRISRSQKHHNSSLGEQSQKLNSPVLRISLSKLKRATAAVDSFLSSRANHIDCSTLWNCLLGENREVISLCEALYKPTSQNATSETYKIEALLTIRLRKQILRQLQQYYQHEFDINSSSLQHSLRGIPNVYSATLTLSSYMNNLEKVRDETQISCRKSLSFKPFSSNLASGQFIVVAQPTSGFDRQNTLALISSHFEVLLASFSAFAKELMVHPTCGDGVSDKMRSKRSLHLGPHHNEHIPDLSGLIKACASSGNHANKYDTFKSTDAYISILRDQLVEQFERCQDSSTICHIIDLVSILSLHNDCKILTNMTKNALSSMYNPSQVSLDLPYAFDKIGQVLEDSSGRDSFVCASFARLYQTANTIFKGKCSPTHAFIHQLLSHWSVLLLSGSSHCKFITRTLECINEVIEVSSTARSRSAKRVLGQIPGLNEKSCSPAFELLLHMAVTSLSVAKPMRRYTEQVANPYDHIINCLGVFSEILSLFRNQRLFFPRRLFFRVTSASLMVVKLGSYHLKKCVEWRSSQPCSLQNLDTQDPAAPRSLQPLIDSISHDCIGSITTFCDSIKRSDPRNGLGYKHYKTIAAISYKCKGLQESIYSICNTHKLLSVPELMPQYNNDGIDEENRQSLKRSITASQEVNNKRVRFDSTTQSSILEQHDGASEPSGIDDESLNDNSEVGSDDDSSFGVMGNWG